ncbi:MAG: class I SAM-dependent methyltransferase [Promethearchaeota archaeon]|nr:MAG: class I SAM-dependent methyltransferase [Candidatus Lokiarchaeota archaeon]
MTRKKFSSKRPKFPDSYVGTHAKEYNRQKWMERNQKKTTVCCLTFLFDEKLGYIKKKDPNALLIGDLGCGTGYSTEILAEYGFRVLGIDLLFDMITKAKARRDRLKDLHYELIMADITRLPLRTHSLQHIISVSAYNFITASARGKRDQQKIMVNTSQSLRKILKKKGRIIIEFYPEDEAELQEFVDSFTSVGFNGFMVKDKPHQKGGQTFLLLEKEEV